MWKNRVPVAVILILFSAAVLFAEEPQGPLLTFATEKFDCGTIYYEDVDIKTIEIEFSNTGDAPLILKRIHACCGTVISHYPREPVLPGETARIIARFRVMSKPHAIRRVVSVLSNSADESQKRYHITGRVEQKSPPKHSDISPES